MNQLSTRAALERKESRGPHFHIDYPSDDENWLKNIVIAQEGDKVRIRHEPTKLDKWTNNTVNNTAKERQNV